MTERKYIERVQWDKASIVDVAIDASIEVLRVEGNIGMETLRRVGVGFAGVLEKPQEVLVILEPEGEIPLIAFIPPTEYRVVGKHLDDDRPPAEARLVVFNPYSAMIAPEYAVYQMHAALEERLGEISNSLHLVRDDLELAFPREYYAKGVDYYNVPLLI